MRNLLQKIQPDYIVVLLILLVGAVTLLYQIGRVPPLYPWSDESEVAADAVASLKDGLQLIYPIQRSGGSMGVWLETGWMALFGRELLGLRLLNGLVNLAGALLLYLLVRHMPLVPADSDRRWLAAAAGLLFVVSTWLLGLGRIATPNWSLVPPITSLAFYWFWRGWQTNRRRFFIAAGAAMGFLFYGYLPGYLVILVPAIFLVLVWLLNLEQRRNLSLLPGLLIFPAALLAAAPALAWFLSNPILVVNRPLQVVHNSELSAGSSMVAGSLDMLATFGLWPAWLLQGNFAELAFDPLVTLLFVAGLLVAVWRWRQPAYLFLLIWWAVMISPAWLSQSASEGFIFEVWRRGVGAQPVSFIFPALALLPAFTWLLHRRPGPRLPLVRVTGLALVVLVSAGFSYWLYFKQWANSELIPTLFAETPVRMVDWMEQTGRADTLFLLPRRPNVSHTTRPDLFTVRYLYDGAAAMAIPLVDEATLDQTLTDWLAAGPAEVRLMLIDRIPLDPKGYFDYALNAVGRDCVRSQEFGFTIVTCRVTNPTALTAPLVPAGVTFGEKLRLVGQRLPAGPLVAGQPLSLALRWATTGAEPVDMSTTLSLVDAQGYELARVDKPLLSQGEYLTTQEWPAGSESTLYYSFPVPADTPPGRVTLRLAAYYTAAGSLLPPAGGDPDLTFPLAEMELQPNPQPVDPAALPIPRRLETLFPNGLRLLGADSSAGVAQQPGDPLRVSLWWQAAGPLAGDSGVVLALAAPEQPPIPLVTAPLPLIPGYPTSRWPAGPVFRTNFTVLLPATLATDDYNLALRLVALPDGSSIGEQLLGTVEVQARPHKFEAEPLAMPLAVDFSTPAGEQLIRLLGYELEEGAVEPGQAVPVRLQWQARALIPDSYKLFLHLTDPSGRIISQVDTLPQQGAARTTSWLPGEIIEDRLTVPLPPAGLARNYRLVLGWYHEKTGRRLLTDQEDGLLLKEGLMVPE